MLANRYPTPAPLISVTIVCYNGERDIRRCLEAMRLQSWPAIEIIAIDNASKDGSVALFKEFPEVILIENAENTGFSAAQNQAIHASRGEWVVCLNLDTRATPTFLEEMWIAMQVEEHIGIVSPKILRMERDGSSPTPSVIDSTGVYVTPTMRHHDRGSQQPDTGQHDTPAYVFGYTGAAAMFRRAMLQDLALDEWFLDEDFFAYREDADFSWRAQLSGWHCLYTPYAVIYHQRHVFEDNRSKVSALINMHSTKNRFLLRINNVTAGVYRQSFFAITLRDLGVIAYCLLKERTSLAGLAFVWQQRKRLYAKRRRIQAKRRVTEEYLCSWFARDPVSRPLSPELASKLSFLRQGKLG